MDSNDDNAAALFQEFMIWRNTSRSSSNLDPDSDDDIVSTGTNGTYFFKPVF